MTYNRIIKKKTLGTVISEGKALTLSAATQTDYWKRPDFVADQLRTTLEEAVKNSPGVIPSRAEEVCARESEHESDKDPRTHITAVATNESQNKAQSIHLPVAKK